MINIEIPGGIREHFLYKNTIDLTLTFSRDLILPFREGIMHTDHFKEHFQTISYQRQSAKITYCLFGVLFGSLCAVIAGAKNWFDIRECVLGHHNWFKRNDLFLNDIPADDTIARIISTIEPEQFNQCFVN